MRKSKANKTTSYVQKDDTEGGHFTGKAAIEELIKSDPTSELAGLKLLRVHFHPGARTHWHSHPQGQILHVVAGRGRVQERGKRVVEINPGDSIYADKDVEHWHGAAPDSIMVHLAIAPYAPEKDTEWKEPVAEHEYFAEAFEDEE